MSISRAKALKWDINFLSPQKCFVMLSQTLVVQGLHIVDSSQSHSDKPHSVLLLWTGKQDSARKYTTLSSDMLQCLRRNSKPQSLQVTGRRPTPQNTRTLGSAHRNKYNTRTLITFTSTSYLYVFACICHTWRHQPQLLSRKMLTITYSPVPLCTSKRENSAPQRRLPLLVFWHSGSV
jgi:hypothetical protein